MHRVTQRLPIPQNELLDIQAQLPPHGSTLWEGRDRNILVARIPGRDPDLVNDLETIAEWASPSHVLEAETCLLLTAKEVHTLPMAPIRSHVERRIAMDRRQAKLLREQLPPRLAHKLYRAVDDPYRRIRLGVRFPVERMRDVGTELLDELAAIMGAELDGGLDDVHCVHLVAAMDDVRIAPDALLSDLLPRLHDDQRRVDAQQRLLRRQQEDQSVRQAEANALRARFQREAGARGMIRSKERMDLDWAPDDGTQDMYARIDALGGGPAAGPSTHSTPERTDAMSRLRQHLMSAGYELRIQPRVPGHDLDLAAERPDPAPQRVLAWSATTLDRDLAERALAATRDLQAGLGLIIAPEATAEGQRSLVATRVRWVPPERVEELRL